MSTLSAAITKSLLKTLPAEAAQRFELSQDDFTEFLQGFLTAQLGKGRARNSGPKGKNGKGRITGYILFSGETRRTLTDLSPQAQTKRLGAMWRALSDEERASFNARSNELNIANGLPAATPAPAPTPAPTPAAPATPEMEVVKDSTSNKWVVKGTKYVVRSSKKRVICGRLKGGKVVKLTAADTKKCGTNGWAVEN